MRKDWEEERRQRVNKIKKTIIGMVIAVIAVLLLVCIILSVRLYGVSKELKETQKQTDMLTAINEALSTGVISYDDLVKGIAAEEPDTETAVSGSYDSAFDQETLMNESEDIPETDPYYIYLTFDDGPSDNTQDILTILREYGVKATFFVNGHEDEESLRLYGDIVQAGHTLGMHSYSHKYNEIYLSQESFRSDLDKLRTLIYDTTGFSPQYYRFPGGSSNTAAAAEDMREFADILHEEDIEYIDWNIDSGDGSGREYSADELVDNVFKNFGRYHVNVVLMHDGSGHRSTVEALPRIIERARNMGAELLPITEDTVPIQHRKNKTNKE